MSNVTNYFSLQGRLSFAERTALGKAGVMRWGQNCPRFDISFETSEEKIKESHSGKRATDDVFSIENTVTTSYGLYGLTLDNLAAAFWASRHVLASGSVSAEPLPPDLAVGDYFALNKQNTSAWALVDSTGTPVPLVKDTHYEETSLFAGHGKVLSLTGLTPPLFASYSHAESNALSLMNQEQDELFLIFDGIETKSKRKCYLELSRHKGKPTSTFSMIHNDGRGQMEFEGEALYDGTNADFPYGKFILGPVVP